MGYIKSADYVVTDSFHGTVFSLIFNRKFVEVAPGVNKTRNENLLNMVGLSDRFVNLENVVDKADKEIDYEDVQKRLEQERLVSWKFLKDAIEL